VNVIYHILNSEMS